MPNRRDAPGCALASTFFVGALKHLRVFFTPMLSLVLSRSKFAVLTAPTHPLPPTLIFPIFNDRELKYTSYT